MVRLKEYDELARQWCEINFNSYMVRLKAAGSTTKIRLFPTSYKLQNKIF